MGEQEPLTVERLHSGDTIDLGSCSLEVIHTPGNSTGSISLYEPESRSLFSGDTLLCNGGVGRWDLPSGNYQQLKLSIRMLNDLDIVNLYPGHDVISEGEGQHHARLARESIELPPFDLIMRRA